MKEAMRAAKELEKHRLASDKEILSIYRDGMKSAEELNRLLKPVWFVSAPRRKVYKSGRVTKSRR